MTIREYYEVRKGRFQAEFFKHLEQRQGYAELWDFLEEQTDFFKAPASTNKHMAFAGGLFLHSCNVYDAFSAKMRTVPHLEPPGDFVFITAYFHDLCKIHMYKHDYKWYKGADSGNKWVQRPVWVVQDRFPFGHGEKSAFLLARYIKLSLEEALAIRWHMGMTDPGVHHFYPSGSAFQAAVSNFPLVRELHLADMAVGSYEEELGFTTLGGETYVVKEDQRFTILK